MRYFLLLLTMLTLVSVVAPAAFGVDVAPAYDAREGGR
jgi:hypothetical protein